MNVILPSAATANPVTRGAVDCDLHPGVPGIATLLPYTPFTPESENP